MTTYLPVLNGMYGMNGNFIDQKLNYSQNIVDNVSQHINNNKKHEVKEIINCISGNFENLLLLISGTNNLYRKESEKNNKNMINIDDNMDSLFYSLKNVNENINDLSVRMEKMESYCQENFMEKMKEYTGQQVNSLRLDLELIYGDILKVFDESTKHKKEKNVVLDLQYDVNSISCGADIAPDVELSVEFDILNYSFVDGKECKDINRNKIFNNQIKKTKKKKKIIKNKINKNNKNNQNKEKNINNVKEREDESLNKCWKYPNCPFGDNCRYYHPNPTTYKRENHRKYNIYYHGHTPSKTRLYYDGNCSLCGRYSHKSEDCVGYDLDEPCDYCNDEHTYLFQCSEKKKVFAH